MKKIFFILMILFTTNIYAECIKFDNFDTRIMKINKYSVDLSVKFTAHNTCNRNLRVSTKIMALDSDDFIVDYAVVNFTIAGKGNYKGREMWYMTRDEYNNADMFRIEYQLY